MKGAESISNGSLSQDSLYREAVDAHGASLDRLARAYEADPEARRDLLQDIHLQLWRSLAGFDRRCSLRTWMYRVAHNVGTTHVVRQRRMRLRLVSLEDIESERFSGASEPFSSASELAANESQALDRLSALIQRLKPLDRQIIVCYLEEMDAVSTGEITGLSPANVSMKVHRIKNILRRWFGEGGSNAE